MKLTSQQKRFISALIATTIIILVMVFSILALSSSIAADGTKIKLYLFLTYLFMSFSMIPSSFFTNIISKNKVEISKNVIIGVIYFALAITAICVPFEPIPFAVISSIYLLTISANRVIKAIEVKKIGLKIFNIFLAVLAFVVMILIAADGSKPESFINALVFVTTVIFIIALVGILRFVFSRIQLKEMTKILKKTYALEVLYGLVVLVISFSFIFYTLEPSMLTYGDALWFSFATITTIGYGDFSVTSYITRTLAVILGIYGILVVAIITSVVVNFYNATKNKKDVDEIENKEEITSQEKEKENDLNQ